MNPEAPTPPLRLRLLPGEYRVVRLPPETPTPEWAHEPRARLLSVTRTPDELSILCAADRIPAGERTGPRQRALMVEGPLDFALTGILAAIARALADAEVPIFAISTFDTDYVLVPAERVGPAAAALRDAGCAVSEG